METTENTEKLKKFISEKFAKGEINNESMVEIIKLCGDYLNLMTPSNYARENNMSYPGVVKCRNIINLFGCKFVIDNE